jgi:hypothetical protein
MVFNATFNNISVISLKFNWGLCNPVQALKGNCFPDYSLIFTLQGTEHNTHNDLNVRTLEFAYYNIKHEDLRSSSIETVLRKRVFVGFFPLKYQ